MSDVRCEMSDVRCLWRAHYYMLNEGVLELGVATLLTSDISHLTSHIWTSVIQHLASSIQHLPLPRRPRCDIIRPTKSPNVI